MGERALKEGSRKRAVALKYHPKKDAAPKVTAKGDGWLAERIIELARQHGIPIHEDPALVQILSRLELHQEIPAETYLIVAEVLAFVYSMNQRWRSLNPREGIGKKFLHPGLPLPDRREGGAMG